LQQRRSGKVRWSCPRHHETTRSAVGVDVSPHMFRTSAASSAAIYGDDNLRLSSALLHHRDERVTEKNYSFASSLSAAQSLRDVVRKQLSEPQPQVDRARYLAGQKPE